MELANVTLRIETAHNMMESCEDVQDRRKMRKYITALVVNKTALLQKEARLAGTAAGELSGSNRAAGIVLHDVWQQKTTCLTYDWRRDSLQWQALLRVLPARLADMLKPEATGKAATRVDKVPPTATVCS